MPEIEYKYLSVEDEALAVPDLNRLLKQLSPEAKEMDLPFMQQVVRQNYLLTARNPEGRIVGMAALIVNYIPTGMVGRIEDVVVDEACRGQGIGRALVARLVEKGRDLGVKFIDLTSNPGRTAANELYKKMGFEPRETNCYRLRLSR